MMDTIEKRSKNKTREQLAEMFIKSLDEQKLPWYAVWNTHPQQNAVSAKPYRGINAFLLSMVASAFGYEDPRWCTFNQAKKKGWSIKKGAKGVPVEFWSAINIRTKEVMDFREAAQKIRDGEAEQGDFRYYNRNFHVFNAAQIEGMPELKRVTPTADIGLIRQNRDTLIKNMAVGFDGNGADCHYSPAQDKIVMPPESDFRDTYGYMCSFLHEAGHATGAPGRLGRGFGSTREEYAIEELRAEIASAMTSQQLGIPLTEEQMQSNLDLHKAYIQGWAQAIKDAPKVLFDAIKDAEQISDYLIDKGEFRQVIEAEQVKEAQEPGAKEEASRDHAAETLDKKPITKMDFSNKGNQYFAEITIEGRTESCPIRCSNGVRRFDRQNQQIERGVVYSFTTSDGVLHRLSPENAERYKSFVEQTVKSQAVLEQAKQPHEPSEEVKAKAL